MRRVATATWVVSLAVLVIGFLYFASAWLSMLFCAPSNPSYATIMFVDFWGFPILGGLHVSGITEWNPWDSNRLDWWPEDKLDPILAGGGYGKKICTVEELEAALGAPAGVAPTKQVWIHEALEDEARRLWAGGLK